MDWLRGSGRGTTEKLVTRLGDSRTRAAAAQELIRLGDAAIPSLVDGLQSEEAGKVQACQQILVQITSSMNALVAALDGAHPTIRAHAAETLGMMRSAAPVPALIAALRGQYFTVRSAAARALAEIRDARAIPALVALLRDPEDVVRIAACEALAAFDNPGNYAELANLLLEDSKIEVRQAAARALARSRNPATLPYFMQALRESFWWYEREQAVNELLELISAFGSNAVEPVIEALDDREGAVRKFAAHILGVIGDRRAVEPLGAALYDLHHDVARAAAQGLARLGADGLHVLIESSHHAEPSIRLNAAWAFGSISDPRSSEALLACLRDAERDVRIQAVQSLGSLREARALPLLAELAADRTDRELAAQARQAIELIN